MWLLCPLFFRLGPTGLLFEGHRSDLPSNLAERHADLIWLWRNQAFYCSISLLLTLLAQPKHPITFPLRLRTALQ